MQEGDVQIKGYPIRLPLDLAIRLQRNPEDYTARGKIITPLRTASVPRFERTIPPLWMKVSPSPRRKPGPAANGQSSHLPTYIQE